MEDRRRTEADRGKVLIAPGPWDIRKNVTGRGSSILQWGMMPTGGEALYWWGAVKLLPERLKQHQHMSCSGGVSVVVIL